MQSVIFMTIYSFFVLSIQIATKNAAEATQRRRAAMLNNGCVCSSPKKFSSKTVFHLGRRRKSEGEWKKFFRQKFFRRRGTQSNNVRRRLHFFAFEEKATTKCLRCFLFSLHLSDYFCQELRLPFVCLCFR